MGVTTRTAAAAAVASAASSRTNDASYCQDINCDVPEGLQSGSCLQDIDLDHEWTNRVLQHGKKCPHGKLEPHDQKYGSELISKYICRFCKEVLIKRRSPNDKRPTHPGPKGSAVNLNLAHAIFASRMNVQTVLELFAEAGIVCPGSKELQELVEKVKNSVSDLSEETLRHNRKEHVAACRSSEQYSGDLVYMDSDGKGHSIARGAVASDGGGETRAYGHHITGSQHCLILFSLVTNEPIYVQNDQISCKQCSLAFTRSIKSKESHFENTPLDFFQ
jgi:hypothetical protein